MDPYSLRLRVIVPLLLVCGVCSVSLLSALNLNASWEVIDERLPEADLRMVIGQYSVEGESETLMLLGGLDEKRRLIFDTQTQTVTHEDTNWLDTDVYCLSKRYASLNGTLFFDNDESSSLKMYDMRADTGTVEDWEGAPHSDIKYACGLCSLLSSLLSL